MHTPPAVMAAAQPGALLYQHGFYVAARALYGSCYAACTAANNQHIGFYGIGIRWWKGVRRAALIIFLSSVYKTSTKR
jgi:hypothetical protein